MLWNLLMKLFYTVLCEKFKKKIVSIHPAELYIRSGETNSMLCVI